MNNYDPNHLPNMTVEQALHISNSRYSDYPEGVRSQATAILSAEQQLNARRGPLEALVAELNDSRNISNMKATQPHTSSPAGDTSVNPTSYHDTSEYYPPNSSTSPAGECDMTKDDCRNDYCDHTQKGEKE